MTRTDDDAEAFYFGRAASPLAAIRKALEQSDAALTAAISSKLRTISHPAREALIFVRSAAAHLPKLEREAAGAKAPPGDNHKPAKSAEPMPPISIGDKVPLRVMADAAQREIAMRHRVYPGRVRDGKMSQSEADAEIYVMRAIRDALRLFAEHEGEVRTALVDAKKKQVLKDEINGISDHPSTTAVLEAFPGATIVDVRPLEEQQSS